ncbi:anaerobic ribonucleoside-triphosphate reductase activating protein [Leeia sp.]|uniref:anaerobic ribonucleoside-triphosphate reductase activating protein n=1 Tax=Leeia sp. TaxID=2884678 RepID=UPI0035AEE66E
MNPPAAEAQPVRLHLQPASPAAGQPALAGITPFSSVDWPGRLVAVLFIGGCPWRCGYCHNPHLQARYRQYHWPDVQRWLISRQGLLDGTVFSGGEPLSEPQLPAMLSQARQLGFATALHTAGMYPQRLASVLPMLDWVGLDIKTRPQDYDSLTGRVHSATPVWRSLDLLLASKVTFECRTSWQASLLPEAELLSLASTLSAKGVHHYAVQQLRDAYGQEQGPPLSAAVQQQLTTLFPRFDYRQANHKN